MKGFFEDCKGGLSKESYLSHKYAFQEGLSMCFTAMSACRDAGVYQCQLCDGLVVNERTACCEFPRILSPRQQFHAKFSDVVIMIPIRSGSHDIEFWSSAGG